MAVELPATYSGATDPKKQLTSLADEYPRMMMTNRLSAVSALSTCNDDEEVAGREKATEAEDRESMFSKRD